MSALEMCTFMEINKVIFIEQTLNAEVQLWERCIEGSTIQPTAAPCVYHGSKSGINLLENICTLRMELSRRPRIIAEIQMMTRVDCGAIPPTKLVITASFTFVVSLHFI